MIEPRDLLDRLEALVGRPWIQGRDDCLTITLEALEIAGVPPMLRPNPWSRLCDLWKSSDLSSAVLSGCFPAGWTMVQAGPIPPEIGVAVWNHPMDGGSRTHVGAVLCGMVWTSARRAGSISIPWFRARDGVAECWSLPPSLLLPC